MRAFRLLNGKNQPRLTEIPTPEPGVGEVLVRITAAGLNFADLLMIEGRYQDTPATPFTLGLEAAGVVAALGPGVEGLAVGARVAVFGGQGAFADYGAFPAARVIEIPDALDMVTGAAFQIAYGTSHLALDHRAKLRPGETLVVLGAGGGVGLTAVEIGALLGARVIAFARGAEKLAAARAAGAAHVFDPTEADIRETVRNLGGADVVYDPVGGEQFTAAFRACRPEARLLTIGFASGTVPDIKANHMLVKNLTVMGLYWGAYLNFAPQVLTGSLQQLARWLAEGKLKAPVKTVLPFERLEDGLALLRARKATGKIVLTMDETAR
ncbi:NADPH:quinone oxidoreductase family protein [Poseidonocella sedimentorum]|uniref:NADPH2:quinone reductase n=1 Tax=Poseidonocella sedimentorum TaxID=871652 RepID=A0A1I6CQ25_9RHOB|nr:NADPH:quinone oxidoreductase family protein [Poseidonocella sedimentorum]SFQ95272.1 NADPH2:quinone reductase [Poseidonocella sedimentorum]